MGNGRRIRIFTVGLALVAILAAVWAGPACTAYVGTTQPSTGGSLAETSAASGTSAGGATTNPDGGLVLQPSDDQEAAYRLQLAPDQQALLGGIAAAWRDGNEATASENWISLIESLRVSSSGVTPADITGLIWQAIWESGMGDGIAKTGSAAELESLVGELDSELDSTGDLSEDTMLKLQMAMDRRSKVIQTLSNIMKKVATTQENIIQNIK